ncbi:uncharacterized protein F5147DRAFT_778484 [Suillus discolor]|uniref:Uncharacterized protein n=1 Tax=Suillus discolor TaxID=1912936 RepID=A0A9P7EZ64_9AGAM|nr:uncharacterized protein F5147DRAFT_778484 [Suillus discolor]KAG2096120.1 hypothetical protein F5147DRAFT_778484 [Suillus discolor]
MAPCKWTSPEQEEWLKPWYDTYKERLMQKSKNHQNFFADLYERWFESWEEPRPEGLPTVSPLNENKDKVMDKAKEARKDFYAWKLYNRFRNCFGSTKAGRQARSDATDVFNSVLKSVMQSDSKSTRNLQETEAYSKLYYTSHVKATHKWAADGASEKGDSSTYEMESEMVKDEVRKYMDDQKAERDKNKDEGMSWSKEDHERNLTKLAVIVNKFLKGLQDATGLLFTVLAGGPSPELNGLIDVWSFHVGRTKLGNDFSTAYPLFDNVSFKCKNTQYSPPKPAEAAALMQSVKNGSPNFRSISDHDTSQPSSLPSSSLHPAWLSLIPSSDDVSLHNSLAPIQETSESHFGNGSDEPFWEFDNMLEKMSQGTPSTSMGIFSNPPPNVPSDQEAVLPAFPSWTSQALVSSSPDSIQLTLPNDSHSAAGMQHDSAVLPSNDTSDGQE